MNQLGLLFLVPLLCTAVNAQKRTLSQEIQYVFPDGTPAPPPPDLATQVFGPAPPRVVESPPSGLQCGAALDQISIEDITGQLTPCVFGVIPSCCDSLAPIFKIGQQRNSPLEGCLCNELILTETVNQIEGVQVTELVGFDASRFMTVLQGCGINFFFGEGDASCPGIIPASLVGGGDDDDDDDDGGNRGGHGSTRPRFGNGSIVRDILLG